MGCDDAKISQIQQQSKPYILPCGCGTRVTRLKVFRFK